jgi:hypothetical protein
LSQEFRKTSIFFVEGTHGKLESEKPCRGLLDMRKPLFNVLPIKWFDVANQNALYSHLQSLYGDSAIG